MNLQCDFSLIEEPEKEKHPAWIHFKKKMKGKQYGREPLNQAWSFFKAAWETCKEYSARVERELVIAQESGANCLAGEFAALAAQKAAEERAERFSRAIDAIHEKYCDGLDCELCALDAPQAPAAPERSPEWPTVTAFARIMIAKLDANQHKGDGWKSDRPEDLLRRLREETTELATMLARKHRDAGGLSKVTPDEYAWWSKRVGEEAADVANFAMMIADACDALWEPGTGGGSK